MYLIIYNTHIRFFWCIKLIEYTFKGDKIYIVRDDYMARKNDKKSLINYESSIKKSKEFSMAKLNQGLTLNQMQLLAYAIYSTQQNGKTEFHKSAFEKKFGIEKYQTIHAKQDAQKLLGLQFSIEDLENDYFEFWNVFGSIKYKEGLFTFRWNEEFVPHILELKEKYITTDLTITSHFKSGFSWTLYDFLKAHYGYWHKIVSKDALIRLFGVENKKTYQNTAQFKRGVLDVAIAEINKYTEFELWYREEKKGRAIVGFDLNWSTGEKVTAATSKQIKELGIIVKTVLEHQLDYVNLKCDELREEAINHIREIQSYLEYTYEPICIKKEQADFALQKSSWILKRLEVIKEQDGKPNLFYNWLEERE